MLYKTFVNKRCKNVIVSLLYLPLVYRPHVLIHMHIAITLAKNGK